MKSVFYAVAIALTALLPGMSAAEQDPKIAATVHVVRDFPPSKEPLLFMNREWFNGIGKPCVISVSTRTSDFKIACQGMIPVEANLKDFPSPITIFSIRINWSDMAVGINK